MIYIDEKPSLSVRAGTAFNLFKSDNTEMKDQVKAIWKKLSDDCGINNVIFGCMGRDPFVRFLIINRDKITPEQKDYFLGIMDMIFAVNHVYWYCGVRDGTPIFFTSDFAIKNTVWRPRIPEVTGLIICADPDTYFNTCFDRG